METACSTLHDGSRLSARHEKDFSHFVVALIVSSSISIFIINSVFLGLAQCYGKMPIVEGKRLTVCVTCAGAGTAKPSSQKKAKACENARDCRRIPSVRCTLCWHALWYGRHRSNYIRCWHGYIYFCYLIIW